MTRPWKQALALLLLCAIPAAGLAQPASLQTTIVTLMQRYEFGFNGKTAPIKLEKLTVDDTQHEIHIYLNESFAMQPFTVESVAALYADWRQHLSQPYASYRLHVYGKNIPVEELVVGGADGSPLRRTWDGTRHHGEAWVTPADRAYKTSGGLEGRHLSLWASHGRYYSQSDREWRWQRPRLFCTAEDLLSQTIVVPFLMPMLENAGAIVWSPRERDWQRHEVIVDNDLPAQGGVYAESDGHHAWQPAGVGFAQRKAVYLDGDTPFADGTTRMVATQSRKNQVATVRWTPSLPTDGRYAVYVAYKTLPSSVDDALYTVCHRGQKTRFRVNQQMGGGTWVYLGTFDFAAGQSIDNCVTLSNQSDRHGHVTADAVRFGGGMGNIARGDDANLDVSHFPRCLEGARYAAQWAGMPYAVYAGKNGENDYAEDINVRSYATNFLARGSAYMPGNEDFVPGDSGLCVPIEMSVALHTDAGYTRDAATVGSLSIYTTDFCDGVMPSGLSRLTSRDAADMILSQVVADMRSTYGQWTRRQMFDRNYSETREPQVPGIILEMLSHQNFADMRLAHDPTFKFSLARAIYKGITRFIHRVHGQRPPVIQPLPVAAPTAFIADGHYSVSVTWQPVDDPLEPSAKADAYVVYHAVDNGGFDNGTLVHSTRYTLEEAQKGVLHRFVITAANDGGQSMPSQEVCAFIAAEKARHVLVVDAFDRLAGPRPFETDDELGFAIETDPGVPIAVMPGYSGRQLYFEKAGYGREGEHGLGYSGGELEGIFLAGNTFDWSTRHAREIVRASGGKLNISSATPQSLPRADIDLRTVGMMDIVFGLEKYDGYSLRMAKVFTPALIDAASILARQGSSLLVSGAYVGSDMSADADRLFTRSVLKYEYNGALASSNFNAITGMAQTFDICRTPDENTCFVPAVDCLVPVSPAFCTMVYAPEELSAAVAYQGADYRALTFGFPLESILDAGVRNSLWTGILQFLLPQ